MSRFRYGHIHSGSYIVDIVGVLLHCHGHYQVCGAFTGATGFIGSAVAPSLIQRGHKVRALVRETSRELDNSVEQVVCDLGNLNNLSAKVFTDIDCVIHGRRAHIMNERASDALGEYRKTIVRSR